MSTTHEHPALDLYLLKTKGTASHLVLMGDYCREGVDSWHKPLQAERESDCTAPGIQHQEGHDELPGMGTAASLTREEVVDGGDVGYGLHG